MMSKESAKKWRERQKQNAERLKNLEYSHVMDRALLSEQRKAISRLEQVIDDAVMVAGKMSIIFPANTIKTSHLPTDKWNVPIHQDFSFCISDEPMQMMMQTKQLDVLLARIDRNALLDSVHFNLEFSNRRLGYAINRLDMQMVPKQVIVGRVCENLAKAFAQEMAAA